MYTSKASVIGVVASSYESTKVIKRDYYLGEDSDNYCRINLIKKNLVSNTW